MSMAIARQISRAALSRPTTHRRQQRHLIVSLQHSLRPGIFLIHRHRDRSQRFPQTRNLEP